MRSNRLPNHNTHCFRCYQRREICLCPIIPSVETSVEFLILRHIYEAEKPSNTGRLAALALTNSKLISCGGGQRIGLACVDDDLLNAPGTWLLWPDGAGTLPRTSDRQSPARVVVIDATWQQARRLYSSLPAFWRMPRLALEAPVAQRKRLRDQHCPNYMSTLEAVAAAVAMLEGGGKNVPLDNLYDELVRRRRSLRWGSKES